MDPEIAALAGTAGTALVSLLTTEAWQAAREGVVAIWRRVLPERADAVGAELEASRRDLLDARHEGDEATAEELAAEWRSRIRRLLRDHPEVADELRSLLTEPGVQPPSVNQHANASGNARVYQAGRDMRLERP
ncbi:hypothetical protein ACWGJ2_24765 [Streptomyces sp. NPDC054796]